MSGQQGFVAGPSVFTSGNTAAQEADVATMYRYDSTTGRIYTWLEDGAQFDYQGSLGWWRGAYSVPNVGDRMVAGDFNGDRLKDVATFQ